MQPFYFFGRLTLEVEGAFLALQESPGGWSTFTLTHTLTHSHSLTNSARPQPRDAHLPPRGGLGQVPAASSTTSAPPSP